MSVQVKSFKIEDADKASEFLSTHKPLGTGGVQLNMGYIVVFYEDGKVSMNNFVRKWEELIGKEIETIEESKHKILRNNRNLEEMVPKGYHSKLTDVELVLLIEKELGEKTPANRNKAKEKAKAIAEIENSNKLAEANIVRSLAEIELYKETIQGYNS